MRSRRFSLFSAFCAAIVIHAIAPTLLSGQEPEAEAPAPGATPASKSRFKKSKLTSDVSEAQADKRTLLLSPGEDKAVDLDFSLDAGANAVTVGNPQIIVPQIVNQNGERRQIVFKPLKEGETTVTVRDADGTIRIIFNVRIGKSNIIRVANEIRSLIRDIEGVEIRVVGAKAVIEGEVLVPADYGRLVTVIQDRAYADTVLNLATLSPLALQVLARKIQEDVNNFAPNVKTRVVNGIIFLEGTVDNPDQARRAAKVASLYLPELRPGNPLERASPEPQRLAARSLVQNFIVINPPPARKQEKLVRVTIHFVELSKDFNKFFGFKWEPGFSASPSLTIGTTATGGVGAGGTSFTAVIQSLIPKLQTAQQAGYARILKSGTLIVRSGQDAKLSEQTEFPFFTPGAQNTVVAGKQPVGLEIAVTPRILGQSEDIDMDLDMNQISLVSRTVAGGPPIVSNHRIKTKIYVKSTESAAVAGVTSNDVGTDFNKDDPAADQAAQGIDPIFTLKRTKNYRKKKSQFVVFVTPQIVENASEGTDDMKRNFRIKVQ